MRALTYENYGGPEVVGLREMPKPTPGKGEVLVRVAAAGVTTADWRLRASAFPGGLWLAGRLMTGLFRPRKRVLGGDFAGTVEAVGEGVTRFQPGDAVFGFSGHGAHADYLVMSADGAIAHRPDGITPAQAAALPFGAVCALEFLRDVAKLRPGQRVLIVGASGGVGVYAVQVAKALGAEVTGVASGSNLGLVRDLGADHVVDYRQTDLTSLSARYDVIFDTVGAVNLAQAKGMLGPRGLFLPLNFSVSDLPRALLSGRKGGPRMVLHVNGDTREHAEALADMIADGQLRPVIDRVYPMEEVHAAYAHVEGRHRRGAVVLDIAGTAERDSAPLSDGTQADVPAGQSSAHPR